MVGDPIHFIHFLHNHSMIDSQITVNLLFLQAKVETWRAQQRIVELEQQLQLVQKNLEAKAQQVLAQQSSSPDELDYARQQLVQAHFTLNDTVQKKAVADAQLKVARREVERLTRELESSGSADEIFALKAQV